MPTVLRALVVDWGGVLTEPLDEAIRAWAEIDGVEVEHYVAVMRSWLGPHQGELARDNPVAALERGEIEVPDFERQLARRLSERAGRPVDSTGLLQRMFDQFEHAPAMAGLVLRARPLREVAPGSAVRAALRELAVAVAADLGLVTAPVRRTRRSRRRVAGSPVHAP